MLRFGCEVYCDFRKYHDLNNTIKSHTSRTPKSPKKKKSKRTIEKDLTHKSNNDYNNRSKDQVDQRSNSNSKVGHKDGRRLSGSRQGQSHGQKKLTGSSISHSVAATNASTRHSNKSGLMLLMMGCSFSDTYLHPIFIVSGHSASSLTSSDYTEDSRSSSSSTNKSGGWGINIIPPTPNPRPT